MFHALFAALPVLIVPWLAKLIWDHKIEIWEIGAAVAVGVVVTIVTALAGGAMMTADTEILNGEVRGKTRVHDSYVRSYDCNCVTSCSGTGQNRSCSTRCSTCYEDHYTVTWECQTNLGPYTIEHLDRTSRSVYRSPDPAFYTSINKGDPVAQGHSFTNYVKAVPESLFHARAELVSKFEGKVPAYPGQIYNFYNLNRALSVGVPVPDLKQWNQDISDVLKKLGPQKQANVIVVFVNTSDQSYLHALEAKWIGGKKNDIIVIIGTTAYPKIDWVAVSSWTDRALFKVQLRDDIMTIGQVDRPAIMKAIEDDTMKLFQRKQMKDFEYLATSISPPLWALCLASLLGIVVAFGCSYAFYKNSSPFNR